MNSNKKNKDLCEGCTLCCEHVTVEFDTPENKEDYEEIMWMLMHENVCVFIDEDGWNVEFKTRCKYLNENRLILDACISKIPGVRSMELEATYLSWVDFSDTGMSKIDFTDRVQKQAQIAASHGDTFGSGGKTFLRFNFATQRHELNKAMERLENAFSDLQ